MPTGDPEPGKKATEIRLPGAQVPCTLSFSLVDRSLLCLFTHLFICCYHAFRIKLKVLIMAFQAPSCFSSLISFFFLFFFFLHPHFLPLFPQSGLLSDLHTCQTSLGLRAFACARMTNLLRASLTFQQANLGLLSC